jgi:2-keto-4-pentenoate hydratase/2-oxohepta-3-ene-1,7-dioic acid hydratase in catechol pathway
MLDLCGETIGFMTDAPLAGARLIAPLRPGKVVAIGLNYLDHIRVAGMERSARPLVLAKFPSSVIGPGEPISIDRLLTQGVDWEVELAVIVGRTMRDGDGQWVRGKSLDTFCPLGPVVVTPDELPDPQMLGLRTRVNGETVQDSSTAEMVFGVAELLAFCSRSFTLEPGDVVLTGTPWGCGEFMDPQRSLAGGDVVEVEVDGIGTLRNEVVEESP